jgi:hemerythrin-like domain-containing protein
MLAMFPILIRRAGRLSCRPMTELLDILREEHRNIETLLRVLERELNIFDRAERPDYEVVQAVIDYFRDYPDRCHHPKEDVVFAKLKARDPAAVRTSSSLAAGLQANDLSVRMPR